MTSKYIERVAVIREYVSQTDNICNEYVNRNKMSHDLKVTLTSNFIGEDRIVASFEIRVWGGDDDHDDDVSSSYHGMSWGSHLGTMADTDSSLG